jgi:hypothetical protein
MTTADDVGRIAATDIVAEVGVFGEITLFVECRFDQSVAANIELE